MPTFKTHRRQGSVARRKPTTRTNAVSGTNRTRPSNSRASVDGDASAEGAKEQAVPRTGVVRDGFVLSKINRSIGTRAESARAPRTYEIPVEVVNEAVVNAVAHRDYTGLEVMLFADRLEVWNPGRLPPSLTLEKLRKAHRSVPANPLLAESLYLTEYIERMGTGTLDMIGHRVDTGLPSSPARRVAGNDRSGSTEEAGAAVWRYGQGAGSDLHGQSARRRVARNDMLSLPRHSPDHSGIYSSSR